MIDDPEIKETAEVFQEIMLDILQRRAVWEALEESAIGKQVDESILTIQAANYVGSQLADLRKFFDTDTRVYQVRTLKAPISPTGKAAMAHDKLFTKWKQDYESLANQYYFHRNPNFNGRGSVSKAELNGFIEEANTFLDELISELTQAGYIVVHLVREVDDGYFLEVKNDAKKFFQEQLSARKG